MSRSDFLLIAACIGIAIGLAHSYLGEKYVFRRLFKLSDLPLLRADRVYTENIIRYAWHLTSVAWWGLAALLVVAWADGPERGRTIAMVVSGTFLLSGIVLVTTAGTRHPAWPLFFVAGLLSLLAVF